MDELKRPTREIVHLIDIDEDAPGIGQTVLALGMGGSLCSVVWGRDSSKFFKAWMPYPKVPKSVKEKLHNLYMNGGWRRDGIGPE